MVNQSTNIISTTTDQESTSSSSSSQKFAPRAFFIQGLPEDETTKNTTTRKLQDLIDKYILLHHQHDDNNKDPSSNNKRIAHQFFFDRNVHRKIRDGSILVLFETSETAQSLFQKLKEKYSVNSDDDKNEFIIIPQIPTSTLLASSSSSSLQSFFSLSISWSAGKLRDHFFPLLPFSVRREILMDPTATFSVTDMKTSIKMAKLICNEMLLSTFCDVGENDKTKNDDDDDKNGDDKNPKSNSVISVCDAFACVGGNTFGFLSIPNSTMNMNIKTEVTSLELDEKRCEMLKKNVELIFGGNPKIQEQNSSSSSLTINQGCSLEFLASCIDDKQKNKFFDVLFFDPPWGGPTEMKESSSSFPKFKVSQKSYDLLIGKQDQKKKEQLKNKDDDGDDQKQEQCEISFDELISSLVLPSSSTSSTNKTRNIASIIALKLPAEKWCEDDWIPKLVKKCVMIDEEKENEEKMRGRERTFPFLFNFGASVRLLCFVQNTDQIPSLSSMKMKMITTSSAKEEEKEDGSAESQPPTRRRTERRMMNNKRLDELVSRIWKFNIRDGDGNRELKPRFYDFEKKRWIELKKWLGSKE